MNVAALPSATCCALLVIVSSGVTCDSIVTNARLGEPIWYAEFSATATINTRSDSTVLSWTVGIMTDRDVWPGGTTRVPPGSVKSVPCAAFPPYASTTVSGTVSA